MLPISFQEIDSWNRLTRSMVTPTEVHILRSMDVVRTRIWNHRSENREPTNLIDVRDGSAIANLFRSMKKTPGEPN